jgi:hypothetical protein
MGRLKPLLQILKYAAARSKMTFKTVSMKVNNTWQDDKAFKVKCMLTLDGRHQLISYMYRTAHGSLGA